MVLASLRGVGPCDIETADLEIDERELVLDRRRLEVGFGGLEAGQALGSGRDGGLEVAEISVAVRKREQEGGVLAVVEFAHPGARLFEIRERPLRFMVSQRLP